VSALVDLNPEDGIDHPYVPARIERASEANAKKVVVAEALANTSIVA
jgi:hypothetical protein